MVSPRERIYRWWVFHMLQEGATKTATRNFWSRFLTPQFPPQVRATLQKIRWQFLSLTPTYWGKPGSQLWIELTQLALIGNSWNKNNKNSKTWCVIIVVPTKCAMSWTDPPCSVKLISFETGLTIVKSCCSMTNFEEEHVSQIHRWKLRHMWWASSLERNVFFNLPLTDTDGAGDGASQIW